MRDLHSKIQKDNLLHLTYIYLWQITDPNGGFEMDLMSISKARLTTLYSIFQLVSLDMICCYEITDKLLLRGTWTPKGLETREEQLREKLNVK